MKTEKQRMLDLMKSYEKKDEVYLSGDKESINEGKLKNEFNRFRKISSGEDNRQFKESYVQMSNLNHQGKTVNSIVDTIGPLGQDSQVKNLGHSQLQPQEALEIAIKRTIKSGNPINNIGFYDEVNWHLNGLGFSSKLPIDIKSAIIEMVSE